MEKTANETITTFPRFRYAENSTVWNIFKFKNPRTNQHEIFLNMFKDSIPFKKRNDKTVHNIYIFPRPRPFI